MMKTLKQKKEGIMGNRAVITLKDIKGKETRKSNQLALYMHMSGSETTVRSFLKYCELKEYRHDCDAFFTLPRLAQVIGNTFENASLMHTSSSVGIDLAKNCDCTNVDNGTYIIEGWQIIDRQYVAFKDMNYIGCDYVNFYANLQEINAAQPLKTQLADDVLEQAAKEMVKEVEAYRSKEIIAELKLTLNITNVFDTFYLKEDEDGEQEVINVRDKMFEHLGNIANKSNVYSLEAVQGLDLDTVANIAQGYLDNDAAYKKLGKIKTKVITINFNDQAGHLVNSFMREVRVYDENDCSVFDLDLESFELGEDYEDDSYELAIYLYETVADTYNITMN